MIRKRLSYEEEWEGLLCGQGALGPGCLDVSLGDYVGLGNEGAVQGLDGEFVDLAQATVGFGEDLLDGVGVEDVGVAPCSAEAVSDVPPSLLVTDVYCPNRNVTVGPPG